MALLSGVGPSVEEFKIEIRHTQVHHPSSRAKAEYHIAGNAECQPDGDHERIEADASISVHKQWPPVQYIYFF